MTLGLVPLLVLGLALVVTLLIRAHQVSTHLDPATGRATGTVQAVTGEGNPKFATVSWVDARGAHHSSRLAFPGSASVQRGTRLSLHYVPGDPGRVNAEGDTTYNLLGVLLGEMVLVVLVLAIALAVTAGRIVRRVLIMRRPTTTLPLSRVHTKVGLLQRSWLAIEKDRREWWVPVFWEPAVGDLLADTPCAVHGDPARDGTVVIDIGDTTVWPSGRRRASPPRGEHRTNPGKWTKGTERRRQTDPQWRPAAQVSMARQALADAVLLLAAPVLALLWAYIDGLGSIGFGLAVALFAGLVFWVPSVYGSDPTRSDPSSGQ